MTFFLVLVNVKGRENFHFLLRRDQHLALTGKAYGDSYTISWLVRAIVLKFIENGLPENLPITRGALGEDPQRFNLGLYGDLKHLKQLVILGGYQLGPLLRYIVDLYLSGKIHIRLKARQSIKRLKKYLPQEWSHPKSIGSQPRIYSFNVDVTYHLKEDYWPVNHRILFRLLTFGLRNRKYLRDLYKPFFY